jgi:hypothetical protein
MSALNVPSSAGISYGYDVYNMDGQWNDVAGNYAFAYLMAGFWYFVYVGQCDSFSKRMPSHESWAEAVRRGATHVLAQTNTAGELARQAQERDIIGRYHPPMNLQHRAA